LRRDPPSLEVMPGDHACRLELMPGDHVGSWGLLQPRGPLGPRAPADAAERSVPCCPRDAEGPEGTVEGRELQAR
jgi:hypothetical protein